MHESIIIIFLGMCCLFTMILGVYMISQNQPMAVGFLLIGFGFLSLVWLCYVWFKPTGEKCNKCNGEGFLPREKCAECGKTK